MGYRVREAQLQKVTYQIVVGDGEQENNTVTIRQSGKKESVTLSLDEALAKFKAEVDNKTLFGKLEFRGQKLASKFFYLFLKKYLQ